MTGQNRAFKNRLKKCRDAAFSGGGLISIRDLFDRVRNAYSGRTCIVEKKSKTTVAYSVDRFARDVKQLSYALENAGLTGRHVGIVGENSYRWIVAFFALTTVGSVAVPIDKELPDSDVVKLLKKADASAVFCSAAYYSASLSMKKDIPDFKCISLSDKKRDGIADFDKFKSSASSYLQTEEFFKSRTPSADDIAVIIFTSGTTGANKGVTLTHGNLCANVDFLSKMIDVRTVFSVLPMNHAYELGCSVLTAIYINAVLYINDRLRNLQKNINEFHPEGMTAVPLIADAFYDMIMNESEKLGKKDRLLKAVKISDSLRNHGVDLRKFIFKDIVDSFGGKLPLIACGGASVNAEKMKFLDDTGFKIIIGYGLTEASPLAAVNFDIRFHPDSVGLPVNGCEVKIDSPSRDGSGEIFIRGKNVTHGYYNDDESNEKSFTSDGWFKTGDFGRIDNDGYLYITGRKKNLIILDNGKNIYPEEIENTIEENSSLIKEAVVFQTQKELDGGGKANVLAAVVGLIPDAFAGKNTDEIMQKVSDEIYRVNRLLPGYKRVHEVKFVLNPMPKTSTMKVIRSDVIKLYYDLDRSKISCTKK